MIKENIEKILKELPPGVELVAAAKGRSVGQIEEAIEAGITLIGENYIKEAEAKFILLGSKLKWHLIGHLQKNKIKTAVRIFDMIETLDSIELGEAIDLECKKINKIMPVLIEVNSASEPQKYGVLLENVEGFVREILRLNNLKLMGLMTMGPKVSAEGKVRPFFKKTKEVFDKIKNTYQDRLGWVYLSMGMSETYKEAIAEGANIVRVGTAIFGER